MATTTGSQSRAWKPHAPEADVPDSADRPDKPDASQTHEADQAAMAAFAAAWTRSPHESQTFEGGDSGAGGVVPVDAGQPRHYVRTTSEYSAPVGIPGRGVIVLSAAAASVVVLLDFALTGGLSMFFDLWFVVICLVGAMAVRRRDLFTAGVLAPLLFGSLIAVVSVVAPATFADAGGFGKVFPTGLTSHAGALVAGYAVALLTVGARVGTRPDRARPPS